MITMIKLKDVTKYYYSDASVTLGLSKINLELGLGEFVAITGESGSGKSTLLNVISGMDTYEEGELYFGKQETSCFNEEDWENYRRDHISLIYQSYNLIDSYTALENIASVLLMCEKTLGKMTKEQRIDYAMNILDKVGLKNHAHHKASHLSSGQKQRLGIARALAKNTDIIIADEPTGNLDIENGKAVMEILHNLSKDKLVIVVTHNYEQAEPFVTRKIRLYDGEIAENIEIRKPENTELINMSSESASNEYSGATSKLMADEDSHISFKDSLRQAFKFVYMNQKGQPHRTFFLFTFLLLATLATLIFVGTLSSASDDVHSKNINNATFSNVNDNRLVVCRNDGMNLTDDDYDILKKLDYVTSVDKYDGACDVNYFYKKGKDYNITYDSLSGELVEVKEVSFIDGSKFVRSACCLSEDDLSSGRLPEKVNEVVLSSGEAAIGDTIDFYFYNDCLWDIIDYQGMTMEVVGILKEKQNQVYFSESLAKSFDVKYNFDYDTHITIHRETVEKATGNITAKDVDKQLPSVFVLNDTLDSNHVRISNAIFSDLWISEGDKTNVTESIMDDGKITVRYNTGRSPLNLPVTVINNGSKSSQTVVELSHDLFEQVYEYQHGTQYSVFIRDYAYTDKVIEALNNEGYDALSVIRFSATSYNSEKLSQRLLLLGISAGATIVIFFLGIFVINGMLKMKKGDFFILRSLGLHNQVLKKTNYINVILLTAISDLLVIAVVNIFSVYSDSVNDIIKYMTPAYYICVVVLNMAMSCFAAKLFNNYLLKTFHITMLREE